MSELKEAIIEAYSGEELMFADGFDDAIMGICTNSYRIIYSINKCIEILMKDMSEEDALEYFSFNVSGAYVGEQTPIYMEDGFNL